MNFENELLVAVFVRMNSEIEFVTGFVNWEQVFWPRQRGKKKKKINYGRVLNAAKNQNFDAAV